jgi:hypothetical protein
MTNEFDGPHATSAMASTVQPVFHQPDPADVGRVGTDDGVAILLTYGPNRDWLKNVVSAGGDRIRRYGKTMELTEPRVMPKAEAAPSVKGQWRPIFARLPFEQAVLLKRA